MLLFVTVLTQMPTTAKGAPSLLPLNIVGADIDFVVGEDGCRHFFPDVVIFFAHVVIFNSEQHTDPPIQHSCPRYQI